MTEISHPDGATKHMGPWTMRSRLLGARRWLQMGCMSPSGGSHSLQANKHMRVFTRTMRTHGACHSSTKSIVGPTAATDEYARANAFARTRNHSRRACVLLVVGEDWAADVKEGLQGRDGSRPCKLTLSKWAPCIQLAPAGGNSSAAMDSGWLPQPRVSGSRAQAPMNRAVGRRRQNLTDAPRLARRPAASLLIPQSLSYSSFQASDGPSRIARPRGSLLDDVATALEILVLPLRSGSAVPERFLVRLVSLV